MIELSIVLIIIGLLVAGVTGGASLIESAKIRSFVNELNSYKQAVFAFKVANDRLPGDLNDDGFVGGCLGEEQPTNCVQTYSASDFPAPYNTASTTPNVGSAPFVDLFLEGLIDFKPDENNITTNGKGTPPSKVFKDGYFGFITFAKNTYESNRYLANSNYGDVFLSYYKSDLSPKILKKIDTMIDDGIYNFGSIKGGCYGSNFNYGYNNYDDAINTNKNCNHIHYNLKLQ